MPASILRSYQVFGADDQILTAAVEAVKQAVKDAKSQGKVQRVALSRRGYRHDIEVGDVFVVPTSVCNDPEDFPTILLNANLRQHTTGEGMVEFQMGALADPKELSRETLQAFKKVCFTNSKGDSAPLVVFAAAWAHPSAYQSFAYEEDNLLGKLREVAYASPFDPSLSAVFDQLRAVDKDQAPGARITPVTQHIYKIQPGDEQDYPEFAKGLDIAGEEGSKKKASLEKPRPIIRLRAAEIPKLEKESLSDEELSLFDAVHDQVQQAVKKGGAIPESTAATFAPQSGSTTEPTTVGGANVPTVEITSLDTAAFATPGEQPGAYVEPEQGARTPGENLELGEDGNVSDRTPDVVDGPDPKTAKAADGPWVIINEKTGEVAKECANHAAAAKAYKKMNADYLSGVEGATQYGMKAKSYHEESKPKKAGADDVRMIMQIPAGQKKVFPIAGQNYIVYFDADVARGDAGQQVPGMISGDYEVHVSPNPDDVASYKTIFRQHVSPGKPGGMQQVYAAEAVVKAILSHANGSGRTPQAPSAEDAGYDKEVANRQPGAMRAPNAIEASAKTAGGHYAYKVDGGIICSGCAKKKGITTGAVNSNSMAVHDTTCKDCGKTMSPAAKGFKDIREVTDKKAAFAADTVQAVNKFIEHWGGRMLSGEGLKSELMKLTSNVKEALIFMRDQGNVVPHGLGTYKVLNSDLKDEAKNPPKLSFVIRNAHKQVWAAEDVEGLKLGGAWSDEPAEAARFASKTAAQDEVRRCMLASEGATIVAKDCTCEGDCSCRVTAAKTAGNWFNPGTVIQEFYPDLQHDQVDSPYIEQTQGPTINPFGAPGKEAPSDPNAMGLSQGLDENAGGVPLRQENSFYGPEFARNFYAPHADIAPGALKLKHHAKGAAAKNAFLPALIAPMIAEAAPALAEAAPMIAEAGVGAASAMLAAPPEKQAGAKKADKSMSLFNGLAMAPSEEEHPQAHVDETAQAGIPSPYNEPVKEDAVPQDETFVSMDALLKGTLAAYAAQLIAAFQVTNKPMALGAPFTDKLDMHMTLEVAGGQNSNATQADAAKAQYDQAMSKLSDDQKKMLVDNAYAQAAVWCPNTDGSGGFNYEVFVRAEALNGPTLVVKVVTGQKGGK